MNNPEEMPKDIQPNLPLWSYQLQRNSKLAVRSRKDIEAQLIARAFKDEKFKQELLANPRVVVQEELDTKLPEDLEINVLEETETTVHMVLPGNPYEGLPESELQTLTGLTYEDVAQWVLEQQRNALLDEDSSVKMIARAWKQPEFKQELLCSPKTVIEKEWGTVIPADIEIETFEETAHTLYLVLPRIGDDMEYMRHLPDRLWENIYVMQFEGETGENTNPVTGAGCPTEVDPLP